MTDIRLFGEIGHEVTATSVAEQLAGQTGDVTVRINSGGGDVYEGIAIMNELRSYDGYVSVVVESLAASAASFIAVGGGDHLAMRPNAELMIHKAWTMQVGNADDMQRIIADLNRQDEKLAAIYAEKAGGTVDEWLGVMAAETWYTAAEAVDAGLADVVEDARSPVEPVAASKVRSRYSCRAEAPPPRLVGGRQSPPENNQMPSDGRKEEAMESLKNLAQELGVEPDALREKLTGFFNEQVEVNTPIMVTYPDEVEVNPTGKVEVEPDTDLPEGLIVEPTIGEGFTAEADESGKVTVRASDAVAVDDTTDLVIGFSSGESVTVKVTVVAVDKEDEDGQGEEAPMEPAAPAEGGPAEFAEGAVTLDRETYNELKAAAQHGWKAMESEKEAKLVAEVDGWVRDGRISAGIRAKAVKAMKVNPELARDLYGSNPKNTIPRVEAGYGVDPEADAEPGVRSTDELRALSQSRMSGKK